MNKKLKFAIPFAVLALTCGVSAGALAGCGHSHNYSEWRHDETQHWKVCPEDGEIDQNSKANHGEPNAEGKCPDCGYELHVHSYTQWGSSVTQHWKECPTDGEIDNSTKAAHGTPNAEGKCPDCGYQILTYVDQACTLVARKDGANTALTTLEGLQVKISKSGEELVEDTDYKVEAGTGNALTIKHIVSGDYTVTITTADGEYRYSGTVKLDGSASKEIILQYNYAIATSQSYYVDLTHMNDTDRSLGINAGSVDAFWQWNAPVPEIQLNLAETVKESKNVELKFKVKAANPNNQPNNAFGVVMTEDYKGVSMSIWDTENDNDGVKLYNIVGNKLAWDAYSADGAATNKWLETAIYGESGVEFRVVRANHTLKYFVKKDGNWVALKSLACPADAKTDIKFMGVGSDYTITDIAVDGAYEETAQNYTATLTVLDAEGEKVALAEGTKGLLIAGDTQYEVALTANEDGTYGIAGSFTPGLYTFSLAGKVTGYTSAAVELAENMTNAQITLGAYAEITHHKGGGDIELAEKVTVSDGNIAINAYTDDIWWQWRTASQSSNVVPAATLNLSDEIKSSRKVRVDFNLKATNPNNGANNAFGIALTEYHNGAIMSFWNVDGEDNETNGIGLWDLKGTWLGEDGWLDDKEGTLKWLETAIYSTGASFRAERDGKNITLSVRKDGEWVKVHEVECYEYAETMVKFLGCGSNFEVSKIKVRIPAEGATEYEINAAFKDDAAHGYVLDYEPTVEEGGEVTLVIKTDNADAAWSWFPNAITVNGTPVDFTTVVKESLGANRCKYTLTIGEILDNTNIEVSVGKGEKVAYAASVNDADMGTLVCDMENYGKEYYWNDACGLTLTAKAGYRLKNIVIGEGETAQTITEGWTKNGLVYTYTHLVTGDIKIAATFEATPEVDLTGVKISVTDKDGKAIEVADGTEVTLTGDYEYTLSLTKNEDGTYTSTEKIYEGTYDFRADGVYFGYAGATAVVAKDAATLKLQLGDVAVATKFHSGDYHGMGEIDFETLIAVDANTVKINTANANGKVVDAFWCWGSEVPEVSLSISDEVKNATNVTLEFNLKAVNSNESPNNAFGIVMAEGYKGVNMSIWSANEKLAYYALTGNVLGGNAFDAANNTHDEWLKTAIQGDTGANIRVVRGVDRIVFYAQNGTAWTQIFATDCAADAKTDIKFLGMGSDFTVSKINITIPADTEKLTIDASANDAAYGEVALKNDKYFVNEECTVIATAKEGYELENIVIGEGETAQTITKDAWVQNGNEYSYSFVLTGAVKVVANFKQLPAAAVTFEVSAKDYDGTAITLADGTEIKFVLGGGATYTYVVGGETNPEKMAVGTYTVKSEGYCDTQVSVPKDGGKLTVELRKPIATATKFHSGDYHGMGECDFETLIENGADYIKINTANANGKVVDAFWCWGSEVPETTLKISDDAKYASNVTLEFNLKAANSNESPNNAFGIVMAEGYKGLNMSIWSKNEKLAYYALTGNVLGGNAYDAAKNTNDAWLKTAIQGETGANIRVVREGAKITFYAQNTTVTEGEQWTKFFETTCDAGALTDIKFLGMGSDYTVSAISVTVSGTKVKADVSVNAEAMGEIELDKPIYYDGQTATVTVTAKTGYELEKIVIGEGDTATTVTTGWTKNGAEYVYSFEVKGDIKVVATLKETPKPDVTFTVTAKDTDGKTAVELANGTQIKLVSADGVNEYTYVVGGTENPAKMAIGEYKVTCYGYADTTATVGAEGGAIAIDLVKVIAYADSTDITIDAAKGTIAIKGNGIEDRENGERLISANLVLDDELKTGDVTLTFNIKRTKANNNGSDWAAKRFGVQLCEGGKGFYVFIRNKAEGFPGGGDGYLGADVAKLPNSLSMNSSPEQKWRGDDPGLAWLVTAANSEAGLDVKVERLNNVISVYAKNGDAWVLLSKDEPKTDNGGTANETPNSGGDLTVSADTKNEIKLLAGGDDWLYSNITVTKPEATTPEQGGTETPETPAEGEEQA